MRFYIKSFLNKKFYLFIIVVLFPLNFLYAALSDGLILHYNFESVTNNVVEDASGNNMVGLLNGSPLTVEGYSGNGMNFPTYSDYLSIQPGFMNSLTDFSITSWVNINSLNTWSRIFDFGSDTNDYLFLSPLAGGGGLRFAIKNKSNEQIISTAETIAAGTWVHVAVLFDWNPSTSTGSGSLYINGIFAASNDNITINPSMLPATTQNYIGKSQYTADPALNGIIDDFRVYNRVITQTELLQITGYSLELINAFQNLTIDGDLSSIKDNLTLSTNGGSSSISIQWSSSMPSAITTEGIVTRPELYDSQVVLTAKITELVNGVEKSMTKKFLVTVLAKSVTSEHWESIVLENDTWSYLAATSEPATNWYQSSFNDLTWATGIGGIGLGDNDDNTIISKCNSVYLRKKFTVADSTLIKKLLLDIDYDDAFVMYLNGVECARSANVTATLPAYNATLSTDHEAVMYNGGSPERFNLKTSNLKNGENVLAIHIINVSATSSDITSRIFLQAKINSGTILYHQTPSWFTDPIDFESSNLPLIMVNTNGQTIIQNGKITADMKVLNSESGMNYLSDTTYEYNGKIGIEIRGYTSANFPKNSYSIETRTDSATNLNVKLLGLPKENDWVFYGPYSDKSLIRNVLAYNLGNRTGKWSPRTKFFELYINDVYKGMYVLVEKIKIDKNRCNIANLNAADTIGDQLTGGYILKLDRPETTDIENIDYWVSPYRARTTLKQKENFIMHDPKGDELLDVQRNYIRNYITDFENAMNSDNYANRAEGYYPYVDMQSFVDYYIITELSRNLDGYRISTFMYKDKDSKGGKLTMGPFWDYNICFGNANFFSAGSTQGWVIDGMGNGDTWAMPFWWEKFRLDPYFNSELKKRWNVVKEEFINTNYINQLIDSCSYDLRDAQKRNFTTWNVLNTYIWPNIYVGGTYANELSYLKNWMNDRINWMNGQIQQLQEITSDLLTPETFPMDLATYPNPFRDIVNFKFYLASNEQVELIIRDLMGRVVFNYSENLTAGIHEIPVETLSFKNTSTIYIYQMNVDGKIRKTGKLIQE